jgi:putative YhdH/YhfP family quinone oxidoreductase
VEEFASQVYSISSVYINGGIPVMIDENFKAMVVEENPDKTFRRNIQFRKIEDLPPGDVLIRVLYSSLNYKDALSSTGNRGVTRNYPHTPGIDAAGLVVSSSDSRFVEGAEVIVTSYDLGMNTAGGFGQYIRVPGDWIVPMPVGLDARESMMLGTAGFTAGMSVAALTRTIRPEKGQILVTGATGGVGSLAVAILAKLGYSVAAVTGKADAGEYLTNIGAATILARKDVEADSARPLLKARWAGVIDTVGGGILASAIKATDMHGVVTCCGNVMSPELPINVFPFILRGVSLLGIDSQNCDMVHRREVWEKLGDDWKPESLASLCREVTLDGLDGEIKIGRAHV